MAILFPYHQKLIEPGGNQLKIKYWNNAYREELKLHIICSIQESQIKLSNNKMAHKCSVHYCYIYCTDQKSMGEISLSLSLSAPIRKWSIFAQLIQELFRPFTYFISEKKLIRLIGFLFLLMKFWQYAFMR